MEWLLGGSFLLTIRVIRVPPAATFSRFKIRRDVFLAARETQQTLTKKKKEHSHSANVSK